MAIDNLQVDTTPLLTAESISVVRGVKTLVDNVSLDLRANELVGLIGPNGAGKSTLLSTLAGLNPPDAGRVVLQGKAIDTYSGNERAKRLGWMEQLASAHWPVSVEHLVTLGRIPYLSRWQSISNDDRLLVRDIMEATDCLMLKDQPVTTLSGGELTRVMLARALAAEPNVLLADEPTAALDIGHQLQTMALLRGFCSHGRAGVVVLHDLSLAARYCDRLFMLNQSKLVASGLPSEVLSPEHIRDVYGVEVTLNTESDIPVLIPLHLSQ